MAQPPPISPVLQRAFEDKKGALTDLLGILQKRMKRKGNGSLLPLLSLEEAIDLRDFASFEAAVQQLATQFAEKPVSRVFKERLYPGFEHLRFFSAALSASTQGDSSAALTWGLMLIVIQCACVFTESLEAIMEQLRDLQELLSDFQGDAERYPASGGVKMKLLLVLEDYFDFCIIIVRNLTRSPLTNFLRNFVSSSLRRDLKNMKAKILKDVNSFNDAVRRAEMQRSKQADEQIQASQLQNVPSYVSSVRNVSNVSNVNNISNVSNINNYSSHASFSKTVATLSYPIRNVNIAENKDFIGREHELQMLYQTLIKEHTQKIPRSCVIYGIGGVGKSQTALRFYYKYRSNFDAVFWVNADPTKPTELLRTFGAIGRKLNLFDTDDVDQTKVELILDWFSTTDRKWLLIFDNVIEWRAVAMYWPNTSQTSSAIIVTSQKLAPWTDNQILLEPLDVEIGSDFLMRQLQIDPSGPQRQLAKEVSERLAGLPLWLSAAQGFMKLTASTLEEYLGLLRESSDFLAAKGQKDWRYQGLCSTTHDVILKQLSGDAKSLLFMLVLMNADEISEDLLQDRHTWQPLQFLNDKSSYLDMIAELAEARLVTREKDGDRWYIKLHRATQEAILSKLNDFHKIEGESGPRSIAFERAVNLLRERFPSPTKLQIPEAHIWPKLSNVLPHVQSILVAYDRARPGAIPFDTFAELLCEVGGLNLYDRGYIKQAYDLSQKAYEILDALKRPPEDPLRGDCLTVIGLCTDSMSLSRRVEGLKVRQQCLTVRTACFDAIPKNKVTQNDHIRLFNSYTDLVCGLQQINEFEQIEEILKKCLTQYKRWGSESEYPYEYAKYYNLMSYVLVYQNKTKEAVKYSKHGYELVETACPGAHLNLLNKFDWANILFQHGDVAMSIQKHQEILNTRIKECGKEHLRTLESKLNLGIILYFSNNLDSAEKHLREVSATEDTDIWPRENTVRANYYLSQVLQKRDPAHQGAVELGEAAKDSLME